MRPLLRNKRGLYEILFFLSAKLSGWRVAGSISDRDKPYLLKQVVIDILLCFTMKDHGSFGYKAYRGIYGEPFCSKAVRNEQSQWTIWFKSRCLRWRLITYPDVKTHANNHCHERVYIAIVTRMRDFYSWTLKDCVF